MSGARIAQVLVAVAALIVAVVILRGGDDHPYTVSVPLENASGLQDGSAVKIGGIDRGKVKLHITPTDAVVADLEFDDGAGPIGRDAQVAVVAANFLGLKRVEVQPGDVAGKPAPSGFTVTSAQVTTPTDLDQVLGVFDADTRTRAKILLNEAGEAVVGRRVDISRLFEQFPVGLEDANTVLRRLKTDDRTMHDLVERSDRFVGEVARQRSALNRLVSTVGETAKTVSARRAQLRQTLARAPGTLRTLRGFLGDLEATTKDLGPAAREITAAAPALAGTLKEVDGFREAAGPTLDTATDVAPSLSRLAKRATPVLRRARPTAQATASLADALVPVSDTLDHSADNIVAILENWSRAIQFRDQLGHVFRGEASFSPDLILTMVDRLTKNAPRKQSAKAAPKPTLPSLKPAPAPVKAITEKLPKKLGEVLKDLPLGKTLDDVNKAIEGVLGGLAPKGRQDGAPSKDSSALLDYLLGS